MTYTDMAKLHATLCATFPCRPGIFREIRRISRDLLTAFRVPIQLILGVFSRRGDLSNARRLRAYATPRQHENPSPSRMSAH